MSRVLTGEKKIGKGMEAGGEENCCAREGFWVLDGKDLTIFLCCGGGVG